MYLLALLISQENQKHSYIRSLYVDTEKTTSIQKITKKRDVNTKNSTLCLQGSKCKELRLNHCIFILQIEEQFLPLQPKEFIKQQVTHSSSSTSRINYIVLINYIVCKCK